MYIVTSKPNLVSLYAGVSHFMLKSPDKFVGLVNDYKNARRVPDFVRGKIVNKNNSLRGFQ